uniref:DJ-1/PfpI domain-containing protein n=1 Tax=Arundo donax TaxID=35708 RepID=A0A0A9GBF2_ARUDO
MEEVAGPLYVRPQHGAEYTIEELNSVEWKCGGTPQILVPVANGSEEMEALNLIDVLRRAGANVTIASVEDKLQIVTRRHKFNLIADMLLDEATKMRFDLIVMPGGLQGAQKFSSTKKLVDLLKKQADLNKPYGAICASPAHVLEPHGLLKGKKATAFPPMSHLLTDQSACEHRVVVDGNIITSRAPGTATEFALAIVEKLFGREKAVSIAKELIFI